MSSILNSLCLALLLVLVTAVRAHAYVDPGTGSYLLQILIAGLLGAAFALKLYWTRVKGFLSGSVFGRNKRKDDRSKSEDGRD
jgi:hypothetical protein